MSSHSCRCLVTGRVQGVFFRASTLAKADELGLSGFARNLSDGRVEVVVSGDPAAIDQMREWLWSGPEYARVSDVSCETIDDPGLDRFSIA